MDLLVCNLNEDETKWCIIPVFSCIDESDRLELLESLRKELEGSSSFLYGMSVRSLKFHLQVDHLEIYDPYAETVGMKKIHFVDTVDKCKTVPCCLFMAYHTYHATPNPKWLAEKGLIDHQHTILDMEYSHGK